MKVLLRWQGGAEALFGNVAERAVDLSDITSITDDCKITDGSNRTDESKSSDSTAWTLRRLLAWLKKDSGFLTGEEDLFFSGDSVKNGVMVLINDTDWELLGELDYELESNDSIVFISTLHGG